MDKEMEQGKKCFIITPIGDTNSATFRKAKGVIDSVIKPVLSEYGFDDIKPAYEINVSGMITTQIINRIIDDDLVVVNLTGNNPNVMYELCLRHVVAKPIIHICENGTTLPFDIKDSRTVFYENDMLGVEELKSSIKEYLDEIDYSKEYSENPIYNATKMGLLLKHFPDEDGKSVEITLLQKIYESVENMNDYSFNKANMQEKELRLNRRYDYKMIFKSSAEDSAVFISCLFDQLNRRNVSPVAQVGNTLYFKNVGNVSHKRIIEVAKATAEKFDAQCEIIREVGRI